MTALVIRGDAASLPLPDECVDLICTSPPYFSLRDYRDGGQSLDGQIGAEASPHEYVDALIACTAEWMRVLKPSGSIFVVLGDKYANDAKWGGRSNAKQAKSDEGLPGYRAKMRTGMPAKSLMGLPWRYAIRCIDELGLILRAEIVWAKPNGLPESVTDRVRRAHEQVFHFTVRPRYYSAVDEIREPHQPQSIARTGRRYLAGDSFSVGTPNTLDPAQFCNPLGKLPGSVWSIPSQPLTVPPALGVDHFAAFPMELPRRLILGWSPPGVCTACGEGRRPVTDKQRTFDGVPVGPGTGGIFGDVKRLSRNKGVGNWRFGAQTDITGYACACSNEELPRLVPGLPDAADENSRESHAGPGQPVAPARPAVVLDPFGGTGTTALLADVNGRTGITVDRSADYCRIAAWRTTDPGERARAMQVPKPPPVAAGQDTLFAI